MLAGLAVALLFIAYCYSLLRLAYPPPQLPSELLRHLATTQPIADEVVAAIDGMLRGPESAKKQMAYLTVLGLLEDRGLPIAERAVALAVDLAWARHRLWLSSPAWCRRRLDDEE